MGRTKSKVLLTTSILGSSLLIFATFGILGPNIPNLTTGTTTGLKRRNSSFRGKNALREDYEVHHHHHHLRTTIREDSEQKDEDMMANLVPSLEKEEEEEEEEDV
jgi:hypothetical protein